MKTLLVLAEHPDFAEALQGGLNPESYKVIHRTGLDQAEPLVVHGLADACILDLELTSVQGVWAIEKLRRIAPKCPLIVYSGETRPEWEEDAYLKGAAHVLTKPVRPRIVMKLLEHLWPVPSRPGDTSLFFPPSAPSSSPPELGPSPAPGAAHTLSVLNDFSCILTHSLNAEAMLRQFLLLLREILCINRAAIFLKQPLASVGAGPGAAHRLRVASSVGISTGLLEHFELSFEAGIGAHLFRHGRILRRESDAARTDLEAQKEFELLGAQIAVPILDRDNVVGVAVFDRRITGEPLHNSELQLVFHLLEQLGLAIKNIWLHDQLAVNHEMMTGIMRELSSACVVVSRDLHILHANKMARRFFGTGQKRGGEMEFPDLPPALAAKVYQVLKTGSALSSFKWEPDSTQNVVYSVSVVPFQRQADGLPASALLTAEDLTQTEQLRRLEIEAAKLRLVETMAERLTNEIGNALVPVSVHQQLLAEKIGSKTVDTEFLRMIERDLAECLRRVGRSNNQMKFLARSGMAANEVFPLAPLLEDAYQEARKFLPSKTAELKYEMGDKPVIIAGDRAALKHAFTELLLNGLQANPGDPKVEIRLQPESNGSTLGRLCMDIQDNGPGFTPETADRASEPFFKTRVVGLGLGLTVSRKIIEMHHGEIEFVVPKTGQFGCVRVSLPLEAKAV